MVKQERQHATARHTFFPKYSLYPLMQCKTDEIAKLTERAEREFE